VKLLLQNSNECDHNPTTVQTDRRTTYATLRAVKTTQNGVSMRTKEKNPHLHLLPCSTNVFNQWRI